MKISENNRVLYLDTRGFPLEREEEIKAAKNAGLNLVIAAPSSAPYKNYEIEHFIEVPLGNYELAERAIADDLRSNNLGIDGVVTWGDQPVELVARVAAILDLPSSTLEATRNVRNKANARRLLEKLDGVNPKYAIVRVKRSYPEGNRQTFKSSLETIGVPCLLKPAGSSGGRGIFKIDSFDKAEAIFQEFMDYCTPNRDEIYSYFSEEILLEEYLEGTEHSVAGMIADGQVNIFAITDKKIDQKIPFQYENVVPSKLSPEIKSKIVAIARDAIKLTGLNWCGFHIDFMVTANGPKILEIGGRLGGECINSHLIPLSVPQLRPYDLLLQVIRGQNPFTKNNFINDAISQAGLRAFLPPKPGRIVKLEGLEKVKNHPNTRNVLQLKQVNDEVLLPSVQFSAYAVGYLVAQCDAKTNIEEILEEIASFVRIEIE